MGYGAPVKYWEIIMENLRNAAIATVSQVPIIEADQFGLWPRSAATLDVLLCMQIRSCLPFSNSNPQLRPTGIMMSAIASARNRMKNWQVIADNLKESGLELRLRFSD